MSGNSLDPYFDRYAGRTRGMTASEIRALFAVASRPEVVSLAGGMPYLPALPMDAVGFKTVRPHPRYPRLRLELKGIVSWREDVEYALERLFGSVTAPDVALRPV